MRLTKLLCKYNQVKSSIRGLVIAQTVNYWPLNVRARFRSQFRLCEICGGQSGTETNFFPRFPLSILFHQCSILIFTYMVLLPERQTGEAWEPSKKKCFYKSRGYIG